MRPMDTHGDERHFTFPDLVDAAEAADISWQQAADNIPATLEVLQPPAEAFSQTFSRPLILSDIDGVLAMLAQVIVVALNAHFGTSYGYELMSTYRLEDVLPGDQSDWLKAQFDLPDFYAVLPPDYAAVGALQAIGRDHEVWIASDRPPVARAVTAAWLGRYEVPNQRLLLQGPGTKRAAVAEGLQNGDSVIWLEDDPEKLPELPAGSCQMWLVRRPWTSAPPYPERVSVFDTWDQVLQALKAPAPSVPQLSEPLRQAL